MQVAVLRLALAQPMSITGCSRAGLPLLPGASTVSEMMALGEKGFSILKFFQPPPQAVYPLSRLWPAPCPISILSDRRYNLGHRPQWLALQNILSGWQLDSPQKLIAERDFDIITQMPMRPQGLKKAETKGVGKF